MDARITYVAPAPKIILSNKQVAAKAADHHIGFFDPKEMKTGNYKNIEFRMLDHEESDTISFHTYDAENNRFVVAVRGTDFTDSGSVRDLVRTAYGEDSTGLTDLIEKSLEGVSSLRDDVREVHGKKVDVAELVFIGHSQGGPVAERLFQAALKNDDFTNKTKTIITYDSFGLGEEDKEETEALYNKHDVTQIIVERTDSWISDIINSIQHKPMAENATMVYVESGGGSSLGLFKHTREGISRDLKKLVGTSKNDANTKIARDISSISSGAVETQAKASEDGNYDNPLNFYQLRPDRGTPNLADNKANIIIGTDSGDKVTLKDSQTATKTITNGEIKVGRSNIAYGQGGDDQLTGNAADNYLSGGAGNDTLYGHAGDDLLDGSSGKDTVRGGSGDDTLVTRDLVDFLDGGTGLDTLVWDHPVGAHIVLTIRSSAAVSTDTTAFILEVFNIEQAIGGDGHDWLYAADMKEDVRLEGGKGNDVLISGAGDDLLIGGLGNDSIDGGTGNDSAHFNYNWSKGAVTMSAGWAVSSSGIWSKTSTGQFTRIWADVNGNNVADGVDEYDYVRRIENFVLVGSGDGDTLTGGTGDDMLFGGSGNDTFIAGLGNDSLDGGAGDDTAHLEYIRSKGAVTMSTGWTMNNAGVWSKTAKGEFIRIWADINANDAEDAADEYDYVRSIESFVIIGGAGNDILTGSSNQDTLTGGAGDDRFILNTPSDDAARADIITDFSDGDKLVFAVGTTAIWIERVYDSNDIWTGLRLYGEAEGKSALGLLNGWNKWLYSSHLGNIDVDIKLHGESDKDTIYGGADDDTIRGGYDDDLLYGDADNDLVVGNYGDDKLYGGSGDDRLYGGTGDDKLYGGSGTDLLVGQAGKDYLNGGPGQDTLSSHICQVGG